MCAGMLLSNQFPVNYFSISEVEQMFPDFEARSSSIPVPYKYSCDSCSWAAPQLRTRRGSRMVS